MLPGTSSWTQQSLNMWLTIYYLCNNFTWVTSHEEDTTVTGKEAKAGRYMV